MREEADVLDAMWDWALSRYAQYRETRHPWYAALARELMAIVRGYGNGSRP